jgi:hypothetical protein
MGYTTEFNGQFNLDHALTAEHHAYLTAFNYSRRMKRNAKQTAELPDPVREAVALPVGKDGAYYVGDSTDYGQSHTSDITDYNHPPSGQSSLWCQWTPSRDGRAIVWDDGEKFYNYVDWIEYVIDHFLAPWGYKVNGEVIWKGEESDDIGMIVVKDNKVTTREGRIV